MMSVLNFYTHTLPWLAQMPIHFVRKCNTNVIMTQLLDLSCPFDCPSVGGMLLTCWVQSPSDYIGW